MQDRKTQLDQIDQVSFVLNDLTLFLDTHPTDENALNLFCEYSTKRKELLDAYQKQYHPLMVDCVKPDEHPESEEFCSYPGQRHFNWVDGPAPWEGGLI